MRLLGRGQTFKIKNRPSHHEIVYSKQHWLIAFSENNKAYGPKST